jgi:hypothetical protein
MWSLMTEMTHLIQLALLIKVMCQVAHGAVLVTKVCPT